MRRIKQEILRLKISMHDSKRMAPFNNLNNCLHQFSCFLLTIMTLLDNPIKKLPPLTNLHHNMDNNIILICSLDPNNLPSLCIDKLYQIDPVLASYQYCNDHAVLVFDMEILRGLRFDHLTKLMLVWLDYIANCRKLPNYGNRDAPPCTIEALFVDFLELEIMYMRSLATVVGFYFLHADINGGPLFKRLNHFSQFDEPVDFHMSKSSIHYII
ncbi:hypothetical protein Leryth_003153 [Lithospermum erythrorhizon]|nr:hypothetical protein Leryth_003153 [Lithospermum erythrorhizon]